MNSRLERLQVLLLEMVTAYTKYLNKIDSQLDQGETLLKNAADILIDMLERETERAKDELV
jgi:hypothetical protein